MAFKQRSGRSVWVCDDCGALWENAVGSSCDTYLDAFAARHGIRASWEELVILSDDYDSGEKDSLEGHVSDSDPDADIKRRANESTL